MGLLFHSTLSPAFFSRIAEGRTQPERTSRRTPWNGWGETIRGRPVTRRGSPRDLQAGWKRTGRCPNEGKPFDRPGQSRYHVGSMKDTGQQTFEKKQGSRRDVERDGH